MSQKEKKPPLLTPLGRLSYPNLFRPRAKEEGGEPVYGCTLIFDEAAQKTPEYTALKKAAAATAKEKWGDKMPATLRSPFRDGADKEQEGYGEGKIFINISSKQKPGIVGTRRDPATGKPEVIDDESLIYAGCYVIASVRPYAYEAKGNKGVAFGLQNIQKRKDGDSLGGRTRADEDFEAVESEEGDNSESAESLFG